MKILIDQGHGGGDSGALAATGQTEARTNFNVGSFLESGLKADGHTVILTRNSHEQYVSILARQALIKKHRPDLVISIHHNGAKSASANGSEVCAQISQAGTYDDKSYRLAYLICEEFKKLGQKIRPIIRKANFLGNADYFGVLRTAAAYGIPAVITEYAFMTNLSDLNKIDTFEKQKIEADAIARAVKEYLG